jgi:mono/diheme cytochrome c family protein
MRRGVRTGVVAAAVLLYLGVAHDSLSVGRAQVPAAPAAVAPRPMSPQKALVDQYCMGCHSDRGKAGGLALSALNLDAVSQHPDIAEKVIRKLRGGLMPPAGSRRPDNQTAAAFVTWLETEIDKKSVDAAAGRVPLRRLNRREYANAVRDLIGLNVDAKALLPDDNIKGHFDNDAGALQV